MSLKRLFIIILVCMVSFGLLVGPAMAAKKKNPLEAWKPKFDPSTAKYKFIVSNISHPVLKGVYTGYAIRDELWKRTNGQMYLDYKPLAMLGGEVEVLNQLQMGAIQGMGCSSVAATNLGKRFGVVNLPFLVNSFEKLEKFANSGKLFDHFLMGMDHQGIMAVDISSYGNYGWATTVPVKTIADAKNVKFRVAEAEVNRLNYKAWGFNPVVMPWPDVPVALKQGVITGLDHTLTVCSITRKFQDAKYFTELNYAQGLFIWLFNKAWFNKLPKDLQKTLKETVSDMSAEARKAAKKQEAEQVIAAKEKYGVTFYKLSKKEMKTLRKQANSVHKKFAPEINKLYKADKYRNKNYLKKVQKLMKY